MFNVVLIHPEIPQNTGNAGRSVLAVNGTLHLIKPIGFSLDDKYLKRAGLDYWEHLDLKVWESADEFFSSVPMSRVFLFSTHGRTRYDQPEYSEGDYLVFGSESKGLGRDFISKNEERSYYIPMPNLTVRSINLSSTVAAVLFEAMRQNDFNGMNLNRST